MSGDDEEYVYDEASGEWMLASQQAAEQADADRVEVRDAVGNILADGDAVTLIKDLEVKGAGQSGTSAAANCFPVSGSNACSIRVRPSLKWASSRRTGCTKATSTVPR